MKKHDCKQGSSEWLALRCGIPTASEFDNLVTPEWKPRIGQTPETYLLKKVAEKVMGYQANQFTSFAMDNGSLLESEAIPMYEGVFGVTVDRVGFCTTDDGRIGCSPDGLIGEDGGLEVKCPEPHTHLGYLLNGGVPKQYMAQVQGCMFVTGRPHWTFISYSRYFPPLIVQVARNEIAQNSLDAALVRFLTEMDLDHAKIQSLLATPGRQ